MQPKIGLLALARLGQQHETRYLCTSKNFITTSEPGPDTVRLDEFSRRFIFSYRWVPTGEGLRFEPVPNNTQAQSLRACHKEGLDSECELAFALPELKKESVRSPTINRGKPRATDTRSS